MSQIYGIYSAIHNKIIYVGQTIIGYELRFKKHLNQCNKKNSKKIHDTISKYGKENFKPILLLECKTEDLNRKEIEMIEYYNTYRNGCNLTIGGETMSGYNHKETTKLKIGEKLKKRWEKDRDSMLESLKKRPPRKQCKEELEKRSVHLTENNPMHSVETKNKLSDTCKNKYKNGYINPNSKTWKITTPTHEIIITNEMKKFCKENGLGYNGMYYAYTHKSCYKGYKIEKVE
jgi:group I intron endonuclease